MTKELSQLLAVVGMDDKHSELYLTGLRIGTAPASDYAKGTGFNRITTYTMLETLVKAGHFTMVRKRRAKWYAPILPDLLMREAQKQTEALKKALPELRALSSTNFRKPHVRYFEGWEGVKHVYDDTLTAHTELLNYANSTIIRKNWPEYDTEYVAERVKRGIKLRGIAPDDATGKRVHGEDKEYLREIRLVSQKQFDFKNEIKIYDNKVATISFGEDEKAVFGIIIESKEVADTQRQIFEMAWRYAGKK